MEERSGPLAWPIIGWTLALAGVCLAWLLPGAQPGAGVGLGAVLMLLGGRLVHAHLARCVTCLVVQDHICRQDVATVARQLADDARILDAAQQAIPHAASLRAGHPCGCVQRPAPAVGSPAGRSTAGRAQPLPS